MPGLFSFYSTQIQAGSKNNKWEVDLPIEMLQSARVSDMERTYDRFLRQLLVYWSIYKSKLDPSWTAITAYYVAYFGGQTLLSMVGRSGRRLSSSGLMPYGLYYMAESNSQYGNHSRVTVTKQGGDSHRFLWIRLQEMLSTVLTVPGNDTKTRGIISTFKKIIEGPPALSGSRNTLNYSIDIDPKNTKHWVSEFSACTDELALEQRALASFPNHEAQRYELVALMSASLSRALYEDYLERTNKPDLRPSVARRSLANQAQAGDLSPGIIWI